MGSPTLADAAIVVVRGDAGVHADTVYTRTIADVCAARGISDSARASTIEPSDTLEGAITAISTVSMFGDVRIVTLNAANDAAALRKLVAASSDAAVLITRCSSRSNPKAAPGLLVIDGRPPRTEEDRRDALRGALARADMILDRRTALALLDRAGTDGAAMDTILAALRSAAGDGPVTPELVATIVNEGETVTPFAFVDTIEAGDIAASMQHLARLAGPSGWAPLRTLGLLRNRWVGAWRIACGAPAPDGYAGTQLSKLARRLGPERLAAGVTHIATAEAALKGGSGLEPNAIVEVCVARLARLGRNR